MYWIIFFPADAGKCSLDLSHAIAKTFISQVVTSVGEGIRPAHTNLSLNTKPGVDMILLAMMSP
jgi:hypothetical protein